MVSTSSYSEQGSKQKGIIHVVRDTTERQAVEEKYRLLFEQVQEGVFVATPDGKLLDCNDAFVKMLGHSTREELMALNVDIELYASAEQREAFRREKDYYSHTKNAAAVIERLAATQPTTLACMHGAAWRGDGRKCCGHWANDWSVLSRNRPGK